MEVPWKSYGSVFAFMAHVDFRGRPGYSLMVLP